MSYASTAPSRRESFAWKPVVKLGNLLRREVQGNHIKSKKCSLISSVMRPTKIYLPTLCKPSLLNPTEFRMNQSSPHYVKTVQTFTKHLTYIITQFGWKTKYNTAANKEILSSHTHRYINFNVSIFIGHTKNCLHKPETAAFTNLPTQACTFSYGQRKINQQIKHKQYWTQRTQTLSRKNSKIQVLTKLGSNKR